MTSGSLATAPTAPPGVPTSTLLSEEYDARRHSVSTVRVNDRAARSGTAGSGGSAPGSAWIAASGAGPPRSRHWENSGITASSSGTGGASGTCEEASAGSRISIRCSGEATAFLVGAHQATTWDFARVVAT